VISASVTNLVVTVPPGATFAPITETLADSRHFQRAVLPTFPGDGTPVNSSTFAPRQNLSTPSGPMQTVIADMDATEKRIWSWRIFYAHVISIFQNVRHARLVGHQFIRGAGYPSGHRRRQRQPHRMTVADVDGTANWTF